MLDIDHFKQYNDRYGHLRGDEMLSSVAAVLRRELRAVDLFGRYGGEEFMAVLPQINKADAQHVAEKLRAAVESHRLDQRITISIGFATFPADGDTLPALIDASDLALFAAKRAGRNRTIAFSPDLRSTDVGATG